jgi:hypothetical protein
VLTTLKERPEARSHVITAWRPDWLKAMSIKPCHVYLIQSHVCSLCMYLARLPGILRDTRRRLLCMNTDGQDLYGLGMQTTA